MSSDEALFRTQQSVEAINDVGCAADRKPPILESSLTVVGIGASAGGLDALKRFFSAMPADSGMAFVVVPHLDPSHRSLMAELLARVTSMKVCEVVDRMTIEPNCVYVIPPNKELSVHSRQLSLSETTDRRGLPVAIDGFFRSLAEDLQEDAIGIVLSGTGSHGTLGLKEIKAVGGLIIAQDPESAEFDQMPRSAISTGLIDYILEPEKMAAALIKYVRQAKSVEIKTASVDKNEAELVGLLLEQLRNRTRLDFRYYRRNMVNRRIQRRMRICQIEKIGSYVDYVRQNEEEMDVLSRDLLIGVTSFFREPDAFQTLRDQVISELVEHHAGDTPIRVWVPGCSTGEEAYSIAILILEEFARVGRAANLQVFASDIDESAIESVRRGVYAASAASGLSTERIHKFFVVTDDHQLQVNKQLRASIAVTRHNLISDAPFSRLDLISCRNLLIYLEPELQQKIISLFHFSLNDSGRLFLGCSESIGRRTELFEPISKKWRIYRRIGPVRPEPVSLPITITTHPDTHFSKTVRTGRRRKGLAEVMQNLLLARYAPAAVLINRKYEVLNLFGRTSDFLEFPAGELTKDLLSLARLGLRSKIRSACRKALGGGAQSTTIHARVSRNGTAFVCEITVSVLHDPPEAEGLLLITFQDATENVSAPSVTALVTEDESTIVQELEFEVETTREDLQSTIEELQTSNEEVMSMNEELQSANEELETSKEELQSFNEELTTVNNQLQDKMEELERANSDFRNLLDSTDIATVFLDTDLRIVRFTPATVQLLHLLDSDIGRPIRDFALRFTDQTLLQDAGRVLDKLVPVETEIRSEDGRSYLRRILPCRTFDDRVDGVAITFVDITERNALQRQLLLIASEENRRIGQDLHDSVGQTLTGLGMLASSLSKTLETHSSVDVSAADRIVQGLAETLEQIRRLSKGLLPVDVEADGLMNALSNLAEITTQDSGVQCDFHLDEPVHLHDSECATQLYRIAQEAVTNSTKSGATHIKISLGIEENQIVLIIRDDGRGISSSAWNSQGIGLKTMQYRAGLLGATLSINPVAKKGTLVSCRLVSNEKRENDPLSD